MPARTIWSDGFTVEELIAAWTSKVSWQRLSQEVTFEVSRSPERTGTSSLADILSFELTWGGVDCPATSCDWDGDDVRWGGASRSWTGAVVFARCLVVGWSGSKIGKKSETAVVRVKRGMAEGINDARTECMREKNEWERRESGRSWLKFKKKV